MPNPIGFDPNLTAQLGAHAVQQQNTKDVSPHKAPKKKTSTTEDSPSLKKSKDNGEDSFKTSITPLIGGEQIFPKARQMIRDAKSHIGIEMYTFGNADIENKHNVPGVTNAQHFQDHRALVDELISASKRGVKVQVVLDSSRGRDGRLNNTDVADHLQANGVEVLRYPKPRANIDHVKLLVVDEKKAMIGGMNWGVHSPVNHDANVLIEGPEAAEFKKEILDSAITFAGGTPTETKLNPNRESKVDVLTTQPVEQDGGSSSIKKALLENIDGAKKSVYAQLFCLTSKEAVQSLKNAHDRGVDVRVLLDPNMYIINRKAFFELKDAGIPVRWYKVDVEKEEKLHGKWAAFDNERTMVGSANWSHMGLDGGKPGDRTNREANVLIHDKEATNIFQETFLYDWENKSSERLPPNKGFK